jgi:hypothetical protein
MEHITAGQEWIRCGDAPVAAAVAGVLVLSDESMVDTDLGELDLLAAAWADAMAAHRAGLVLGNEDDAALTSAALRARWLDAERLAEQEIPLAVAA